MKGMEEVEREIERREKREERREKREETVASRRIMAVLLLS
jgi:hypothetical protein